MALQEGRLAHGHCNVPLDVEIKVRLQIRDRRQLDLVCGWRRRWRTQENCRGCERGEEQNEKHVSEWGGDGPSQPSPLVQVALLLVVGTTVTGNLLATPIV